MSLDDPRLQSLLERDVETRLILGFGGAVFLAAGIGLIFHHLANPYPAMKQVEAAVMGGAIIAIGIAMMYGAIHGRPQDSTPLRWITNERDKVRGWRILPGSNVGVMDTKILLVAHEGEDEVLVLVKGKEAPVLSYLTEHLPRLDG